MAGPGARAAQIPHLGPAPRADLAPPPPLLPRRPLRGAGLEVDTSNRQEVVNLFDDVYMPALSVPPGWTGSTVGCDPGTTSPGFVPAAVQMVNYFRAMSGLPGDVVEDPGASAEGNEAALIMKANGSLTHMVPSGWACYTADGAEAALRSNLALGTAGASAIRLYVSDPGAGNTAVGHRRWILYPPLAAVGSGETDSSNALWVISTGAHPVWGPRPAAPQWIAWPPEGHVPFQVVYPRWSLSQNPSANFGSATVSMSVDGTPLEVNLLPVQNGFGDNTLVWELQEPGLQIGPSIPDQTVSVTVSNILVGSTPTSVSYDVIIIDPALVFADGFESGDTSAWTTP